MTHHVSSWPQVSSASEYETENEVYADTSESLASLNQCLCEIGETPVSKHKLQQTKYAKQKIKKSLQGSGYFCKLLSAVVTDLRSHWYGRNSHTSTLWLVGDSFVGVVMLIEWVATSVAPLWLGHDIQYHRLSKVEQIMRIWNTAVEILHLQYTWKWNNSWLGL